MLSCYILYKSKHRQPQQITFCRISIAERSTASGSAIWDQQLTTSASNTRATGTSVSTSCLVRVHAHEFITIYPRAHSVSLPRPLPPSISTLYSHRGLMYRMRQNQWRQRCTSRPGQIRAPRATPWHHRAVSTMRMCKRCLCHVGLVSVMFA